MDDLIFEIFIGGCVVMLIGMLGPPVVSQMERRRKLRLLKEHPELAKEIWASIEGHEAHYRAEQGKVMGALNKALTPEKVEAVVDAAIAKLGLGIAKRLIK